jgi:hypothetical protein
MIIAKKALATFREQRQDTAEIYFFGQVAEVRE